MKSYKTIKLIIIILIFVFSLKTLSEIAYIKGDKKDSIDPDMIKLSTKIFPFVSGNFHRYGRYLLENYNQNRDRKVLQQSRDMFVMSLRLNNLNYFSHFLLGRTYLSSDSTDPTEFEKGMRLLENVSAIRKTNLGVNIDTIKIYLSLWPFIDEKDKETAISLMKISMDHIDKKNFEEIMEAWGFYSKDRKFLSSVSTEHGKHKFIILRELLKHELEISFRHKLLAQHEHFVFTDCESKNIKSKNSIKKSSDLYYKVSGWIRGYYKFSSGSKFRETLWRNLKKELLNRLIKLNLNELSKNNTANIVLYSQTYLNEFKSISDVEILHEILSHKRFFESNDMKVFYLKQLINIKTGQVSKVINETEGFRQSVSFIRDAQGEDFQKLLYLLTDAYIYSRLLTKAMDVLKGLEKVSPGLMSTYWRLMKVESIIGEDSTFDALRTEKFDLVRNSNKILMNKNNIKSSVFPYEIDKIILDLDDSYAKKFREYHLLQVFINGRIFNESYIEELRFPMEFLISEELKKKKFEVEVNLVK